MKHNESVVKFLNELRDVAVEKEIRATEAVRLAIEKFPAASRIEIKHSAIAVGINALTARNVFDRMKDAA